MTLLTTSRRGLAGLTLALSSLAGLAACESNDTTDGGFSPGYDAGHDAPAEHDAAVAPSSGASSSVATTGASAPGVTATTTPGDTTTPSASGGASSGGGGTPVINEINGKGGDYVELFNGGVTPIDLGGWGVTEAKHEDAGTAGEMPKKPVVFAAGTMLAPGGYALAMGAPKDGGTPVDCPPGVECVQATWNVSDSSGATIYLQDPSGTSVETESFPGNSSSGQSWGRIPNGTGSFEINTQTPGAANEAP